MTSVHENMLNDLVFPCEIVGKRTRMSADSGRLVRVFLDEKDRQNVENKTALLSAVYKKMTGTDVKFEFPVQA
eukprot:GABW01001418.1.p1 GENE.GABW01001418.1~~GABW01001418.1.p1  ORF type:complete len:73 (-),score=20.20 GABW01001418.1:60-278(-)